MSLSEKAKGKQRAVDSLVEHGTNTEEAAGPSEPAVRHLTVRFTDGIPDMQVLVEHRDAVRDVKRKIREGRPQLERRRLRLIHSGRLLTDGTFLYEWLVSLEERQRRASDLSSTSDAPSIPAQALTWLHCSVGAELAEGEEDETRTQIAQLKPLRGFDRLVAAGFSESDIANFRQQFHSQSADNYLDSDMLDENDADYEEHLRALEEQWIDNIDAGTTSNSNSSTATAPMVQGLLIGFFFPLLPFYFMREQKPAIFWESGAPHDLPGTQVFSKRQQVSIVVGFVINLILGMWRYLLASP